LDPRPEFRHSGAVFVDLRDRRRSELHRLRDSDPARLITMYRHVAALGGDGPLPVGATFVSMVETILDDETGAATTIDESH